MLWGFFEKHQIEDEKIAVGVSGGADSLALVLMLDEYTDKKIVALSVDHGLRKESAQEAQYVSDLMKKFGIEHHTLQWLGEKPANGVEEAAREARYGLLLDWCDANNVKSLAVAHHQKDQAETFFMRLQRGSGLSGLCGMLPVVEMRGVKILRPLLNENPENLKEYLNEKKIAWVEDPSNQCEDFLRVRVRNFLPCLEKMLGIDCKRIAETMQVLSRSRDYMEEQTQKLMKNNVHFFENCGASFSLNFFQDLHPEMKYRLLSFIIQKIGRNVYVSRADDVQRLCDCICSNRFRGATLGRCEIFLNAEKVFVVSELRNEKFASKKEWQEFVEKNPQYKKIKIPHKLRLCLMRINPIL